MCTEHIAVPVYALRIDIFCLLPCQPYLVFTKVLPISRALWNIESYSMFEEQNVNADCLNSGIAKIRHTFLFPFLPHDKPDDALMHVM